MWASGPHSGCKDSKGAVKEAAMQPGRGQATGARLMILLGVVALVLAALPGGAVAQQAAPPVVVEVRRLAEDTYLFRHNTYQAIFIVTDQGVIATDPIGLVNPAVPAL